MAPPSLVHAGSPVLRKPAAPVRPEQLKTEVFGRMVEGMVACMRAAPGVGLAAPQLDVPLRVFICEDTEARMAHLTEAERLDRGRVPFPLKVFINPVLEFPRSGRATFLEGCLSVPGYTALVDRWHEVAITALDLSGETVRWRVSGWPARILQHEVDHLDGVLYVDRMVSRSFCQVEEAQARWAHRSVEEMKAGLGIPDEQPTGF